MNVARRTLGKLTSSTSGVWHRQPAVSAERIGQLADAFRQRLSVLGKAPDAAADDLWLEFCRRLEQHAQDDDPMEFLRWPVIESTMNVIAGYLDLELEYVRSHPGYESHWRNGLRETRVGRPTPYWKHPWTSGNTIHQTYHLCRFSDATRASLDNVRFVFEFGGGYGNFCRLLFAQGFKGQYVIFDLPHFSALQSFYLDAAGLAPGAVSGERGVTLVTRPDEAGRILRNADLARSLFVGTWSLSETPLASRDWIAEHLVRFSHILLAYQNEFCGTDNADYFSRLEQRLRASHACCIEDIAHIPGNSYLFASSAGYLAEKVERLSAPELPARSPPVNGHRAARAPDHVIPLMKNAFLREQESKDALAAFIRSADRLSMGEQCRRFEEAFATVQGRRNAVLVNSGSSANLLLLQSLKNVGRLKAGDKVGFSALTWATNVMPIIQMGFEPVPIDCEYNTLNVSSRTLLDRLSEVDLRAFFVTNALGFAGDLGELRRICAERDILLIEDNCEALGTELPEGKAGNFGVAASFSFFVAHHMSTIEGGMLATDDAELAAMFRMARTNGWDRNLAPADQARLRKEHDVGSELYAKYTFYDLAFNVRPTEITGFLGLQQLALLDENVILRRRNYHEIEKSVIRNPAFIPIDHRHIKSISPFAMPFICRNREFFHRYTAAFVEAGIEIRPMIAGNIQLQPFYQKHVSRTYALPNTDLIHHCGFYCGNYPELTRADLDTLTNCLRVESRGIAAGFPGQATPVETLRAVAARRR